MSNVAVVQSIYEAFGRGDIPAILEKLSDNIDWEYAYRAAPHPVPWLQPRAGKAGVAQFFQSLDALEFNQFTPKVLLEGTDLVVALIDLQVKVKQTGRPIVEQDEAHIWHFDSAGKVVRFRQCADTYQHMRAYQG